MKGCLGAGSSLPTLTVDAVDPGRMKVLALLLGDPNPIHYDAGAARELGVADRQVNQGPSNMAMLANVVTSAFPDGRLVRLRTELRGIVVAGERVHARGSVMEVRQLDGGGVLVRCEVVLEVEGRGRVLTGDADVLVSAEDVSRP
jgi:acyl dehydratase